jgi:hypothetical protein
MATTTITLLKQLKAHLAGKLQSERVERKAKPLDASTTALTAKPPAVLYALSTEYENYDRFASYRDKIIPKLLESGYGYFLACDSADHIEHQKWCDQYSIDGSLPHCDVWQVSAKYPRAFASKTDAAMFKITFDANNIEN